MLGQDEEISAAFAPTDRESGEFLSLVDGFWAQAACRPSGTAIIDSRENVSFGALAARIDCVAAPISTITDPGPVAILLPNNATFLVAVLAAQRARRTYVLIDAEFPDERVRQIVDHAGAAAIIVDAETDALATRAAPHVSRIRTSPSDTGGKVSYFPPADPARIVSISYTSGSTGEPKGVMRTEQALLSRTRYFLAESAIGPQDRVPVLQPLAIGSGLNRALGALMAGAQICIVDIRRVGAASALKTLSAFRPTVYFMVPSLFRALFGPEGDYNPALTHDVRWTRIGADRVLRSDVEIYRRRFPKSCRLWISIGSNETHTYASWHLDHNTTLDRPLVPVGYPLPSIDLSIENEDGTPAAPGEIGQIVIASGRLAEGYWANDALTHARFSQGERGTMRYRTGDFGRLLPDGLLEFVGRHDRQVKVRGNTIHLSEIEAALDTCPDISEAAVVSRPASGEIQLVVYCVGAAQADLPGIARDAIRQRLPAPMWPSEVVVLPALPRLPGGKVDLEELQRLDRERAATQNAAPPPQPALSHLAAIVRDSWDSVIGAGAFDSGRPFVDAGGHSVAAMRIVMLLERALGRSLPANLLGPDVRPQDILERLSLPDDGVTCRDNDTPDILFFPQMFGTGLAFSDFLGRLEAHFRVRVMRYDDADGQTIATIDPEAYFEAIMRNICANPPKRLWIVGYIFGCRVAVETARRLQMRGVAIEFVGLIAGSTARVQASRSRRRGPVSKPALRERIASYNGLRDFLVGRVTVRLAHSRAKGLVRLVAAALARSGLSHAAIETILMARKTAAEAAFKALPSGPLTLPVTVFVTTAETSESVYAPDLGWNEFCPTVAVVPIAGGRRETLKGVGADAILAAFTDTETRLRSTRQGPDNTQP